MALSALSWTTGNESRDMALWAHVPLGGAKSSGAPGTGLPTVVVHQQVGDDLAALQIETVEV